ncbi:MAG: hypothetical protein HY903_22150 [Deltaproteobacteria bacterium]|nr:hypothetical protein [Deltaproteobacteria bacterium]
MTSSPMPPAALHLDLRALAGETWHLFASRARLHLAAGLILIGLSLVSAGLLAAPLLVGYIRLIDRLRRGEDGDAREVLDGLAAFGPAVATGLVQVVAAAVGTLFVVLPGLVIMGGTAYALWFVALADLAPVDAIGAALRLAKAHVSSLLLILLLAAALNLLGAMILVGVVVSVPLSLILVTLGFYAMRPADKAR